MNKALERAMILKESETQKLGENEDLEDNLLSNALQDAVKLNNKETLKKEKGVLDFNKEDRRKFWIGFKALFLQFSVTLTITVILLLFVSSLALLLVEIWLGWWSINFFDLTNQEYFSYYLIINGSTAAVYMGTQFLFRYLGRRGMMIFYKKTIDELLHKDLTFYSENSDGNIIYRLTKDFMILDTNLVSSIEKILSSLLLIIGGVVILAIATYGSFIVFFIIVILRFSYLLKMNLQASKSFFKISNSLKSKLLSLLTDISDNILSLRNLKSGDYFDNRFYNLSDDYQNSASHLGNLSVAWLGIQTTLYNSILLIAVYLFVLIFMIVNPNYLLNNLYIISFSLNWIIKLRTYLEATIPDIVNAETHMYSFHHINDFGIFGEKKNEIEAKKNLVVDTNCNTYELENVSFSYGGKINIFQGLNLIAKPGEKICLMGKSGSGRHSLIQILMKNYEKISYSKDEKFKIFGQNIEEIDPISLRSQVNYLSNDPILFYGSVRENIDTENEFNDEEIIEVLIKLNFLEVLDSVIIEDDFENDVENMVVIEDVDINEENDQKENEEIMENGEREIENKDENEDVKDFLDSLAAHITSISKGEAPPKVEKKLESEINLAEKSRIREFLDKDNLSVTNKSIIKMILTAKAILQKLPLLFMEEGCLNFNNKSERETYNYIISELPNTTVLSIMSKFIYIFKYDKIAVLSHGKVQEFGTPIELLKDPNSEFIGLMRERNPGLLEKMVRIPEFVNEIKEKWMIKSQSIPSFESFG